MNKNSDSFKIQNSKFKTILVTGGAGFIGSEFARQSVERGHRTIVVDKLTYAGDTERIKTVENGIRFYKSDIANREFIEQIFEMEKPDIVVHWAAESHVDRSILDASPFIDANVKGTQVLLDVAKNSDIKLFVNVATDEIYGELGKNGRFHENTPINPNSPYSVSKAAADLLGKAYYRTYGLPVITIRPSNNYGLWQYPEKLIPVVILKALNNEPVPVYGKGENIREWLFVSDCVDAVFAIIEKGRAGESYNIGSGQEKRNIDVVKAILHLLNKPESLINFVKDRPGHDFRYSLDTKKIETEIDWRAKIEFENGIETTVNWYIDNLDWVNKKMDYLMQYWKLTYK